MTKEAPSPRDWAFSQFGSCALGDRRRTSRLVQVGERVLSDTSASLPKQIEDWSDLKAAYRLLGSEDVTHESVSTPHWAATLASVRDIGGIVLFVQDDSELDYRSHRNTSPDLGFIGNGQGYGIALHSTLCVLPGEPAKVVGLAHQAPWTRPAKPQARSAGPKGRTEHDVWEETISAIGPAPSPASGTSWVSVGDRASDVFAYLSRAVELGWHCLIRSKFNRVLAGEEDGNRRKLHERARSLAPMAQTVIELRARPGVPARVVNLNLAWAEVTLPRPFRKGGKGPLTVNCVRVWEEGEPGRKPEPLEWILLTTLPVSDAQGALQIVRFYRHRWLIEEYHKCLKTGCQVENRHLGGRRKLFAIIGLLSIVAVYLLQFKAPCGRRHPPPEAVAALKAIRPTKDDLNDPRLFWRRVAMLGGFLGRKGDGEPGWQTLWAGWTRLQDILRGMELAREAKCG